MRIRKNARISALSLSSPWISHPPSTTPSPLPSLVIPNTDKCELNMSPWDAIALTPQLDFSRPLQSQVEETSSKVIKEELVVLNGSIGLSKKQCKEEVKKVAVIKQEVEEDASLLNEVDKKVKKNDQIIVKREFVCCIRKDGKGWQCKNEAKESHSLCEHHLNKLKCNSYSFQKSHVEKISKKSKAPLKVPAMVVVPRGRKAKKKNDSATEFSSGINPCDTKRALGNGEDNKKKGSDGEIIGECSQTSYAHEYIEDVLCDSTDDDDDNNASDGSRKRQRKPIKARSLRSLF